IARERVNRMGLLFHAAHVAMALAGGGDWATAKAQLEAVRARAPKDPTGLMGDVLAPLVEGIHAFGQGDYRTSIAKIEPLRPRLAPSRSRCYRSTTPTCSSRWTAAAAAGWSGSRRS